jgi:hypothetical protein
MLSLKSLVIAAAVAVGTFGFADRADAQWRRYNYVYPTYYTYPTYTYSVASPVVTTDGVVTSGYNTYYYPSQSYYTTPMYSYPAYTYPTYTYPGGYVNWSGGYWGGRRIWRW